jgi:hypothetical protein
MSKTLPSFNPGIMHQTITGILWNKREIEASSMCIGTLRGSNLYQPPDCDPQTRNHKQALIFVKLADAFRLIETARAAGRAGLNKSL